MADKHLLVIRHGEVADANRNRYIGTTDCRLSHSGCKACLGLIPEVEAFAADLVFSSPLQRAVETVQLLFGEDMKPIIDRRISEIDFGRWENLTFDEICADAPPEQIRLWAEFPEQMVFPGGESAVDFALRVDEFFGELTLRPEARIAVVTHGGVIRHLAGFQVPRGALLRMKLEGNTWYAE